MTFAQYIDNPMGKANAVFAGRENFRQTYTEKFDLLYMREAGNIRKMAYYDKPHDTYYCHIKIPSETVKDFFYDVVIQFYTKDPAQRTNSSLKGYDVRFFSNDPAFVYTYMYVFLKHDMLIPDLKVKCPKASLTTRPVERNAYEVPGYVKSIYFAFLLMSRTDLFLKTTYINNGQRYSKTGLLNQVATFDNKMAERNEKDARQKAQAKVNKANQNRISSRKPNPPQAHHANKVNRIGTISGKNRQSRAGNVGTVKGVRYGKPKPNKH